MANAMDSSTRWAAPLLSVSATSHNMDEPASPQALSHAPAAATMTTSAITSSSSSSSLDSNADLTDDNAALVLKSSPVKTATSALTAKNLMQSMWDDDETKKPGSTIRQQHQPEHSPLRTATSSLAKFKAAQDLKIQTENLPESPKPKENGSTSSSTFTTPGTDTSSATVTPETPVPPSSTGKKRRRRTAAQIDRKFSCNYPGCVKAYGSEGSLTQHQRLKHRQPQPETGAGAPNNQLGSFFLPLTRTARNSISGSTSYTRPPAGQSRTVNIRPATMEGVMSPISFDMSGSGMSDATSELLMGPRSFTEQLLSAAAGPASSSSTSKRQNLRSRSNSMPVSFSTPVPRLTKQVSSSSAASSSTARPQPTRKSRASCAPRAKAAPSSTTNRRGKCRSKSETLSEPMDSSSNVNSLFLAFSNDMKPPRSDRSVSDSFVSNHDSLIMPMSNTQSIASSSRHSYDWSSSIASDSPSSDQAIDSDILSVLADCDSSDVGESFDSQGPPSTSSFRSSYAESVDGDDQDMGMMGSSGAGTGMSGMDCFGISETAPITLATEGGGGLRINDLFRRAEMAEGAGAGRHQSSKRGGVDLEAFSPIKSDNWADAGAPVSSGGGGQSPNSVYLSTHMEKMSMIHGAPTTPARQHQQTLKSDPSDPLVPLQIPLHDSRNRQSSSHTTAGEESLPGVMSSLDQFASVSSESFAIKQVPDLEPESMDICEPAGVKEESFVRMMEEDVDSATTATSNNSSSSHWTLKNHNDNSIGAGHDSGVSMMKSDPQQQQQQQQQHWMKDFPNLSVLEAQNQYVDELFQGTTAAATMRGGSNNNHHDWKAQKTTHGGSPRNFLRGPPAPPAHSTLFPSDKHVAAFSNSAGSSLGDFLFDVSEYGLEDTRMGSPLLCQQEEL